MRRKTLRMVPLLVALAVLVLAGASSQASTPGSRGEIMVFLDGQQLSFDVQPRMTGGRVLVPLRAIFAALGAEVQWDPASRSVSAKKGPTEIRLAVKSRTAYQDGQPVALDAAPTVVAGRTLVPVRFVGQALGAKVEWETASRTVKISTPAPDLPVVGSYENLKRLLQEAEPLATVMYGAANGVARKTEEAGAPQRAAPESAPTADYSRTNVQVEGVDEADIVKTDGRYIYRVTGHRVAVVQAYPVGEMQVVATLKFDQDFTPQELYVDSRYLVVIGTGGREVIPYDPGPQKKIAPEIYPPPPYQQPTVKAVIYDIRDKENIRQLREVALEGNYVSSRKIGPALYLVASQGINYYIMEQENEGVTPSYRDSAAGDEFTRIGYPQIYYFPGFTSPSYLIVAGLNLDRPEEKADISTYLGAGENIYASPDNLYVAVTRHIMVEAQPAPERGLIAPPADTGTAIYKFSLEAGRIIYQGRGEVPGTVLNQFSMDEYQGRFRVATTRGEVWRSDEHTSKNNIYILDKNLKLVGKLEGIAPGERIYSARFMGERAYLVTFQKVDPFFVIDLADPQNPKILGALKIPGYSDYLHPFDKNHIIGFGKETIELAPEGPRGETGETMAFYQGLKMAVFDVSDVEHPVEMFKEVIGDRGTDSELLHNHKALLFDRGRNLLAFPVTVMEIKDKAPVEQGGFPTYGEFTFQGAYVYNLDLEHGFTLKGRITHLDKEDYARAGNAWYDDSDKNVERAVYIGDVLYTLSPSMIKAHRLDTLEEIGSTTLP
ncbi:MAG: hypothetical protein D9V47_12430 [Clostridia bacterium]|nr:MAG: hypothetical protein D9V47_12430 [Clostridia bacterium]